MDCSCHDSLLLILLDHTVAMVLSATEYLGDIFCGFGVNGDPRKHGNAFGYGRQMCEKGGSSIGFSNVIDGTHHRLQVLQDFHIDWGLNVRLPGFRGDYEKFALCSEGSKDSSRLRVRGLAFQVFPP